MRGGVLAAVFAAVVAVVTVTLTLGAEATLLRIGGIVLGLALVAVSGALLAVTVARAKEPANRD